MFQMEMNRNVGSIISAYVLCNKAIVTVRDCPVLPTLLTYVTFEIQSLQMVFTGCCFDHFGGCIKIKSTTLSFHENDYGVASHVCKTHTII